MSIIRRLAIFSMITPFANLACGGSDGGSEDDTSRRSAAVCVDEGENPEECPSETSGGDGSTPAYPSYPAEQYNPKCGSGDGKKYACCESDARAYARELIDWLRREETNEELEQDPELLRQLWEAWKGIIAGEKSVCAAIGAEWKLCRSGLIVPEFDCFNLPMPQWTANGGVDSGLPALPPPAPVQEQSGGGDRGIHVDDGSCSPCVLGTYVESGTCMGYCGGIWGGDACYVNLC
jgi:hypothetical protein